MSAAPPALLTAEQVAERYGMTKESLSNWRLAGKGPAYIRLGSGSRARVMYRVADVEEWELNNRKGQNEKA